MVNLLILGIPEVEILIDGESTTKTNSTGYYTLNKLTTSFMTLEA